MRYEKTINLRTLDEEEIAQLKRGQWVTDGKRRGRYMGSTTAQVNMVDWLE